MREFIRKMKGKGQSPPIVSKEEIFWSWLGGFFGIFSLTITNYTLLRELNLPLLIGSFGASAVLVYGAIRSPLAQPRNLVGGHILSALIGVACYKFFTDQLWLSASLAVSLAIVAMHITKTLHPPGGATALIAVIGDKKIHDLGFFYAIVPVGIGAIILLIVALIVNNLPKSRHYPEYWI